MKNPLQQWWRPFGRFLLSGGFNTVVTYGLYLLLLPLLGYEASYTLAFVTGILLAYSLNRLFVFRVQGGMGVALLFPLVYLVQYLAGLGVVALWVEIAGWPAELAPLAAIVLTIPLTFILSHWLFMGKRAY